MKNIQLLGGIIAIIIISAIGYLIITYAEPFEDDEEQLLLLKEEVRAELKKYDMLKRIKNNRGLITPREDFEKPEILSTYQKYVTPNHPAVTNYISTSGITSITEAYTQAISWTWVSDIILHNKGEWWLKPKEFIQDTPNKNLYPNNPVDGMASDCESQAYTLVSILRGIGLSAENVRVATGNVSFSGTNSGHAWVQIYNQGEWYELEATSGPYWDDENQKLVTSTGFNINYFKTHPYPVNEYYAFFNDIYYYNPTNNVKTNNLPGHWNI